MKRTISIFALLILFAAAPAWAADVTAGLDLNSAYVWRGITFNDGLVAQPSVDVAYKGFGFNVWGNFDLDDYKGTIANPNNFSEVDLTLSYGMTVQKLDIGVGLIEYLFPTAGSNDPGTRELYLSLGYPLVFGFSVGLDVYYDVDEVHDFYSDLTLSYALDITEQLGLEAGAKVAYAGKDYAVYYGGTDGGWYDYSFSLGLSYAITDALSVGANINYVNTMDKDVLPEADIANGVYGVDTEVYGGVSVSYAF